MLQEGGKPSVLSFNLLIKVVLNLLMLVKPLTYKDSKGDTCIFKLTNIFFSFAGIY